jgi:hypothetical protein
MKKYYIYHIPTFLHKDGRIGKIGCSEEPDARTNNQGYTDYEILEEHECIYKASDRERELQKEYGYPVDSVPYFISRRNWGSKAGKVGGNTKSDLRDKKCSELGKRTGPINALLMSKNRRTYKGEGNHNCQITENQAQEILDYFTQLFNSRNSKYGLIPMVKAHFPNISPNIVRKICKRETWRHLSATPERGSTIGSSS